MKPRQAVLTHLHVDVDYDEITAQLPEGVIAAFDGMVLESLIYGNKF
jgi:phosphoribosyl 1,2-cyclic phosphate phosphodiesterase